LTSEVRSLIIIVGGATALYAGTVALVQMDIKKVIAYSTCSQLGYMVLGCGMELESISLFHLMNHAFFKALLFLAAGNIIHAMRDEQDIRRYGGLLTGMPGTYVLILSSTGALLALPYLTGYYSKEKILQALNGGASGAEIMGGVAGYVTAGLTAFYSIRLLYLTYIQTTRGTAQREVEEVSLKTLLVLLPLGIGSIMFGYICKEAYTQAGGAYLTESFLSQNAYVESVISKGMMEHSAPLIITIIGILLGSVPYIYGRLGIYEKQKNLAPMKWARLKRGQIYSFIAQKWYIDKVYNRLIVGKLMELGYKTTYVEIEKGIIEGTINSILRGITRIATWMKESLYSGDIREYLRIAWIGLLLMALYQ